MMALVSTPAMFAVPTSINKGFNPPFVLRVGVISTAPTQIKATVAAYVLQKDQAGLPCLPYLSVAFIPLYFTTLITYCRAYLWPYFLDSSLFGDPTTLLH